MGMTIDTAMRNLSMYDIDECGNAELHTWYKGIEEDMEESFKVAISTMRKYQRIQAIVEAWKADVDIDSYDCMADIYEVVEDGNDN